MGTQKRICEVAILSILLTECPIPVLKARKLSQSLNHGDIVKVIATDPLAEADFEHYCEQSNYQYLGCLKEKEKIFIRFVYKSDI